MPVTIAAPTASACAAYVTPAPARGRGGDAAAIASATRRAPAGVRVGLVLADGGWRVAWAAPADAEPGVFFLRGPPGRERLVDVWGGVATDASAAERWARRLGAPAGLARCFAERLVRKGP